MMLQPGDIAVDYIAKKDPALLVAAGVKLVVRYDAPNPNNPKNLTRPERVGLHNAGLGVLRVFEDAATSPLGGAPVGARHGALAGQHALADEYPAEYEIIVAVDFDVQPAQMPTVLAYLGAFKTASGRPQGTYGKDAVITAAHDAGLSTLGWQTAAWSYGRISPHAHVLQHARPVHPAVAALGSIDDNTVLRPFRAWSLAADQPPPHQEDDMPAFISNGQTPKYGSAPSPQSGCSIWELLADHTGKTTKRLLNFYDWAAYGSPFGVVCSDETLDNIPDWSPAPAASADPAVIVALNDAVGRLGQNQSGAANQLKRAAEALAGGG